MFANLDVPLPNIPVITSVVGEMKRSTYRALRHVFPIARAADLRHPKTKATVIGVAKNR